MDNYPDGFKDLYPDIYRSIYCESGDDDDDDEPYRYTCEYCGEKITVYDHPYIGKLEPIALCADCKPEYMEREGISETEFNKMFTGEFLEEVK